MDMFVKKSRFACGRHFSAARLALTLCAVAVSSICAVAEQPAQQKFIDYGPASSLLEIEVHAMAGGSTVGQNYSKIYPRIQERNVNMGNSWGAGAKAVFGLRNYLGLGTAANVMWNNYNIDLAVVGQDNMSMSAVFVENRNFTFNVPVFISFRFNVAHSVRWNVDLGAYYSYGFAGRQKQKIYRAEINAVDELVPEIQTVSTDYYHSPRSLFNVFNRSDIGIHFATLLNFGPHLSVGFQTQYGLKNSARRGGVDKTSVHNYSLHGVVGYRF